MRALLLAACLLIAVSAAAQSQTSDNSVPASSPAATSAPVPVPEPSDKAMSYYRSGIAWWLADLAWGFALPALLLFTGFSAAHAHVGGADWPEVVLRHRGVLHPVLAGHLRPRPAACVLRRVRARARVRAVESDVRQVGGRFRHRLAGEHGDGRAVSLGAVPAAQKKSSTMVALHGTPGGAVSLLHPARHAGLDRSALQHVRFDEEHRARIRKSWRSPIARGLPAAGCTRSTRASTQRR